jgi:hypothetical protein
VIVGADTTNAAATHPAKAVIVHRPAAQVHQPDPSRLMVVVNAAVLVFAATEPTVIRSGGGVCGEEVCPNTAEVRNTKHSAHTRRQCLNPSTKVISAPGTISLWQRGQLTGYLPS